MNVTGAPIVLVCDFGLPYTGQMKGRLSADAPDVCVVDLFHDIPAQDICAGSVLLAAHVDDFPVGSLFICVVDPGVGSGARTPGAVYVGGRWFVDPLNGLFEHTLRRFRGGKAFEITWQPENISATFHGRDLFCPVAAKIYHGDYHCLTEISLPDVRENSFADNVFRVIYADNFGNLVTGIQADSLGLNESLCVLGHNLPIVSTFLDVKSGEMFVYKNSVGLLEISVNCGNALKTLGIDSFPDVEIITV